MAHKPVSRWAGQSIHTSHLWMQLQSQLPVELLKRRFGVGAGAGQGRRKRRDRDKHCAVIMLMRHVRWAPICQLPKVRRRSAVFRGAFGSSRRTSIALDTHVLLLFARSSFAVSCSRLTRPDAARMLAACANLAMHECFELWNTAAAADVWELVPDQGHGAGEVQYTIYIYLISFVYV